MTFEVLDVENLHQALDPGLTRARAGMYGPAGDRTVTETKLRFKSSDFMIAVAAIRVSSPPSSARGCRSAKTDETWPAP